jgi:2-polyprenyl-3-methyl-5-hydroxy-6-metoxy-1,4-benzoquinol methylase
MKPEQREDQRYKNEEFCTISKEEELMFSLLKQYSPKREAVLRLLDLGCGSGRISAKVKDLGYDVTGLDFSEEAVKKTIARGISAKQANLDEGIPEDANQFDVVWAGDIVEHVFDPIGLLTEAYRVLKPNGIMLITIPSDVGLVSRIKMLFGISHQEQMYYSSGFYKHHTFFTPKLIRFMLKKANLDIVAFHKILILGQKRFTVSLLPSAFFNEMIIAARKNS